ncbi:hypothetical protein Droror1_Dr00017646 [Drosera rotundifolia]
MSQALFLLQDFKLGHYMKIPPRAMFMAELVGAIVSVAVYIGTAWWLMGSIHDLRDTALLPANSQWKCPQDKVFFDVSAIWGLVGPRRIFGDLGEYSKSWARYNYILSGGLDAGTAFLTLLVFFSLQYVNNIGLDWSGNTREGCPLAACPTAKGIVVDGCPVF